MKNFICSGEILDYVVSGSAVTSGQGILLGTLFGVCAKAGAVGETVAVHLEGAFSLPKASGAITQGAACYWDNTAKNITTTASGNTKVAAAFTAALTGDTTVQVVLQNSI